MVVMVDIMVNSSAACQRNHGKIGRGATSKDRQ
jgi:hypothetical protein